MTTASERLEGCDDALDTRPFYRCLVSKHAAQHSKLSLSAQARYRARAQEDIASMISELNSEKESLSDTIAMLQQRWDRELASSQGMCRKNTCVWSDASRIRFLEMVQDHGKYPASYIQSLKEASILEASPPNFARMTELVGYPQLCMEPYQQDMPFWRVLVCKHRHVFRIFAFGLTLGGTRRWLFFLSPSGSPSGCSFIPLIRIDSHDLAKDPSGSDVGRRHHAYCFQVQSYILHDDLVSLHSADQIEIVPCCKFGGGCVAFSDCLGMDLETFLSGLPPSPQNSTGKRRRIFEEDMPTDSAASRRVLPKVVGAHAPVALVAGAPATAARELSEEEASMIWDAVELRRLDFEIAEGKAQAEDVAFNLRVGKTAHRRKGEVSDCLRATFCTDLGHRFVKRYKMPLSFDCHFSVYTDHEAAVLCHSWCDRAQYFCDRWQTALTHGAEYVFAQADLDGYAEPAFLTRELVHFARRPVVMTKLSIVRKLAPTNP